MSPERDMKPLEPLGGPLAPEVEAPRDPFYEDDKTSCLKDEWYAEEREFWDDMRERCREL